MANEYALLDRPIVFIDVPELFELTLRKNARLDLETWGRRGGEVVAGVSEALAAVEAGLADPGARSDVRRALVADLFFNPGHATAAAMDWISRELEWCMSTTHRRPCCRPAGSAWPRSATGSVRSRARTAATCARPSPPRSW